MLLTLSMKLKMTQFNKNISYNYVFIMPYVEIDDTYGFDEFVKNNIIDKNKLEEINKDKTVINNYLRKSNSEIELNLLLLEICPEYYLINSHAHINDKFKKISFYDEEYKYTATMLEQEQIENVVSINYGNTIFKGGSGSGKTICHSPQRGVLRGCLSGNADGGRHDLLQGVVLGTGRAVS